MRLPTPVLKPADRLGDPKRVVKDENSEMGRWSAGTVRPVPAPIDNPSQCLED
jgi:hypothetical protein